MVHYVTEYEILLFSGGNNNFQYPNDVMIPEGLSNDEVSLIFSHLSFNWEPEHRIAAMREIEEPIIYNKWDFLLELARAYFEFGDYYNSKKLYDNIYESTGGLLMGHWDLIYYSKLLVSSGNSSRIKDLVSEPGSYAKSNSQTRHSLLCVTEYHDGNITKAYYHYVMIIVNNSVKPGIANLS